MKRNEECMLMRINTIYYNDADCQTEVMPSRVYEYDRWSANASLACVLPRRMQIINDYITRLFVHLCGRFSCSQTHSNSRPLLPCQ